MRADRFMLMRVATSMSACLVLGAYAAEKTVDKSPEAKGTYADTQVEAIVSGTEQGVAPILQRMRPVITDMVNNPAPGSWLSWRRNPQAWGYSPLKQINKEQRAVWYGSMLATGGGLVFSGDVDRWFFASDARTGDIVWRTRLAVPTQGYPVSYEVDGRQYLAVPTGVGMAIPQLTPELRTPSSGSTLFVFAVQQ
jgi:glucose dehydrogenase